MKLKELEALKPGTEVYVLYGYLAADGNITDRKIEKGIFKSIYKELPEHPGPKFVLFQARGYRGLGYSDSVFLTREDAEIALVEFLLK